MNDITEFKKAAKQAGAWWAERLVKGDKKLFAYFIEKAVEEELAKNGTVLLECDYDPKGILLEAVNHIGHECKGFMFSADGILPTKHSLMVFPDKLKPKEGYGNWTDEIVF